MSLVSKELLLQKTYTAPSGAEYTMKRSKNPEGTEDILDIDVKGSMFTSANVQFNTVSANQFNFELRKSGTNEQVKEFLEAIRDFASESLELLD